MDVNMDDAPAGKRNGNVQVADFEALFHDQLDAVVAHLQAELPDAGYDKANLAQLLVQLLQFMEDVSGKNGTHKGQPKIPIKLFKDTRADGPLFALAARIHQIKKLRDMKSVEFNNPQRRREHLEIYLNCRRELEKLNLIQQPKVFLDRSCLAQDQSKMKEIICRLGGQIAGAADEEGVTHHVFPFPSTGDPDDGKVYLRVQEFRGTKALVHWWYLPDSYDEYVARDLVPDQLEPDPEPSGPLKVYLRWVYDSERYNEWMNPTDYETKEAQEEQDQQQAAAGGGTGLKAAEQGHGGAHPAGAAGAGMQAASTLHTHQGMPGSNPLHAQQQLPPGFPRGLGPHGQIAGKRPPSPSRPDPHALLNSIKRLKAAEAVLPELAPGPGEKRGLTVTKRQLQEPLKIVTDGALPSENLSLGQRVPMAGASRAHQLAELQAQRGGSPGSAPAPGPSSERAAARPAVPRRVDSSWFNLDAINELERQGMPEFFSSRCPSQTPRTYKEARNFIVRKYREQPDRRLQFSEVKDELAGDVNALHRLFEFLEERGIINPAAPGAGPNQQQGARPSGPQSTFKAALEREGPHRRFLYSPPHNSHEEGLQATLSGGASFNLQTRKAMFNHKPVTDLASTADHYCSVMPWVKCNDVRYHCSKMPSVELCPKAFSEGRFPAGLSSRDFVRVDHRLPQLDENGWSAAENLLLLTGLELFGDNWSQVADHVGTKSQVQCILQFLQMPIDDLFISDMENGLRAPGGPRVPGPLPFTDTPNAVMAQVAFLATMVGPRVAAAVAMRALELLGQQVPASSGTDEVDLTQIPVPNEKVTEAAAQGLAAAAAQARLQADQEERELQRLVAAAMQLQAQKIDVKLKYLDSLDRVLEVEHAALEAARAQQDSQLLLLKEQQQQGQGQGQGQLQQQQQGQGQHAVLNTQQLPASL